MSHHEKQQALNLARDQAIEWSLRLDNHPDDEGIRAAFEGWITASDLHLQAWCDLAELDRQLDAAFIPAALHMSVEAIDQPRQISVNKRKKRYGFGISAVVVAALLLIAWAPNLLLQINSDHWNRDITPQQITLADGTIITLAADTAIRVMLNDAARNVYLLRGEAIFEVARDPSKPFHVYGDDTRVAVLGTVFNVALLKDKVSLDVSEGHVEFSYSRPSAEIHSLYASDRITFHADGRSDRGKLKPGEFAPWLKGKVIAENLPVEDLVHQLQRYSSAKILVMNDRIMKSKVTGIFDLTRPEQALEALALANEGHLINLGMTISIH